MLNNLLTINLFIHGLFYIVTGIWSVVHLRSFMDFTDNYADPFKTQVNGALFSILGSYFLYSSLTNINPITIITAVASALTVSLFDFVYLIRNETTKIFFLDALIEGLLAIIYLIVIILSNLNLNTSLIIYMVT